MKIARLTRRIALAAVGSAVAVSAVGVPTAQAGVPANILVSKAAINIRPTLHYFAPTDDLSAVANSLTLTTKSTTTDIRAAAGLELAHPVSISATYRDPHSPALLHGTGRNYDQVSGTSLVWSYPAANSGLFRAPIHVTLTEVVSPTDTETFSINWNPILLPLYDVRISPLTFTLTSFRGIGKDTDLIIWWQDTYGRIQYRDVDVFVGKPKPILQFAQSFSEVSAFSTVPSVYRGSPLLASPVFTFYPSLWSTWAAPEYLMHQTPLVTGQGYRVDKTLHLTQLYGVGDWKGRFQYSVTQQLHTYASL
jgi:hypothetical protein